MAAIKIEDYNGRSPDKKVSEILQGVVSKLNTQSGKVIQIAVSDTVKRHFQAIYPGSEHYSPNNVVNGTATGNSAEVVVDVPGVTRAYHNLNIFPKRASRLAIPMHREAFGLSPRDVGGLFYTKNSNGTEMLAKTEGGALVVMYILKDRVHQRQDKSLMPSDQTFADNVGARLAAWLSRSAT